MTRNSVAMTLTDCQSPPLHRAPARGAAGRQSEESVVTLAAEPGAAVGGLDAGIASLRGVTMSRTTVSVSADLEFDEWVGLGRRLFRIADASAWWIGDWLVYGEWRYGEKYHTAVEQFGLSYDRLRDYVYVASNVPAAVRRADLTFRHHRLVAKLGVEEQRMWLALAAEREWSARALGEAIKQAPQRTAARAAVLAPRGAADRRVRLAAASEQLAVWRDAAGYAGLDLQEWARQTLDDAASRVHRARGVPQAAGPPQRRNRQALSFADAIARFRRGYPVALINDLASRAWSGLLLAAERMDEAGLRMMIAAGPGTLTVCMSAHRCDRLGIATETGSPCPMSAWIVHRDAPTTNIYAARLFTIRRLVDDATTKHELVSPGVLPVAPARPIAQESDLNQRGTAGAVAVARLAKLRPVTATVGLSDDSGNPMSEHDVVAYAATLGLATVRLTEVLGATAEGSRPASPRRRNAHRPGIVRAQR
jgi:3,4-dihydroxy-2-butanone 4-phosphate synthase